MTSEQQQIAIAKTCGWKRILTPHDDDWHLQDTETLSRLCGRISAFRHVEGYREPIPDYLNDLNAMYEAEENFPHPSDWYQHNLALVCGGSNKIYRATAAQRAEAFLRTFNLWTE